MSDLQRAWAKSKLDVSTDIFKESERESEDDTLAELPEHMDDDSSSASSASSTGTVIPSPNQKLFARPQGVSRAKSFQPIPWTAYFERELSLAPGDGSGIVYHAFLTSPSENGPLFVMHHGGGSSGLSFAALTSEIRTRNPTAGVLAVDCRGHGSTTVSSEEALDLKLNTLSEDLFTMIQLTKTQMGWKTLPTIILVGHSLGGAVVTELAKSGKLGGSLLGFVLLDVVEGSAMDALQSMQTYLSARPSGFASIAAGIEWHLRTRTIRNQNSARTSVPALLSYDEATQDSDRPWRWRTDLSATQRFWKDWFVNLSKKFLEARGAKLLMLAGTDRLDKELMIGQMQGKFAMQVYPEAGHFIHEDIPEKAAVALVDFYKRNDRSTMVLPPKVSEMLARGEKV